MKIAIKDFSKCDQICSFLRNIIDNIDQLEYLVIIIKDNDWKKIYWSLFSTDMVSTE